MQTTPSKSHLDKIRHGYNHFDPSPVPKSSSLAALMSRSEVSLIRHPPRKEGRHGSLVDAQDAGDSQSDPSVAATLKELRDTVAGLSSLVEDLKSRLDQQSGVTGSEDEG